MVLGDLGCIDAADTHIRLVKKLRPSDSGEDVGVTTPQYRPPDVFLGNQRFREDLDMWSLGCVAAELFSRQPLIRVSAAEDPRERDKAVTGKDCIDAIRKEVGLPCWDVGLPGWPYLPDVFEPGTVETAASFLDSFPFFPKWFEDCLKWKPEHRLTLSEARLSGFLQPPGKVPQIALSMERGKNGTGTILEAVLDPDLLHLLQHDPCWDVLAKQRVDTGGQPSPDAFERMRRKRVSKPRSRASWTRRTPPSAAG